MTDGAGRAERTILDLLDARTGTICPSDAARRLDPEGWRDRMDEVRAAAGRLAAAGEVEITQRGEVIDLDTAKGPIRIRKVW
ncbi:DUF3253 domain-containing protein [Pseudonocardia pini]|uniref:DUF3253 domain-containing protein n=1 Tax=Pseudonocardia pini TaxID=2758030 RepID=UPI0015F11894|nr:DUF3253 domain-containing protein [Pseudonocardia pini]